ncbi:MAG: hypothetical protein WBA45_01890 [Microthrixaceae bacterium]
MNSEIDVLIVADKGDPHGSAVGRSLDELDSTWLRISYGDLTETSITWEPGSPLDIRRDDSVWTVSKATTVWWRRSGAADTGELGQLEAALYHDEVHAIVPAALDSIGVRWVDAPATQWAAGQKLRQLATASRLGISHPDTLVTGSPDAARDWANERTTPIVAKAVSSGFGIAPFVGTVPPEEFARVKHCPTMLQERVDSTADLRVVTIGDQAISWHRPRRQGRGQTDWRRVDPAGADFRHTERPSVEESAQSIAAALGLTFSVQDWLEVGDGEVFLEVNPQGQWLFLADAETTIVPALAAHLYTGLRGRHGD